MFDPLYWSKAQSKRLNFSSLKTTKIQFNHIYRSIYSSVFIVGAFSVCDFFPVVKFFYHWRVVYTLSIVYSCKFKKKSEDKCSHIYNLFTYFDMSNFIIHLLIFYTVENYILIFCYLVYFIIYLLMRYSAYD